MTLLSIKLYVALLWGMSVLFAVLSLSASSVNSTAETHKLAEISVAAPAETTASLSVETEEAVVSNSGLVAMNTAAATTSSTDQIRSVLRTSTAVTTSAGATHPSHNTTIVEIVKPTEDQMRHQSPTISANAAPAVTTTVSSLQPTSTTEPQVTSSSTSAANSTLSSPSASTTATMTANPTSEAAPVFDPSTGETSTTSAERLSTPQPAAVTGTSTSQFPDTTGSNSSADPSTASFSTHSPIITTNVSTTNVSTTNVPTSNIPTNNDSTIDIPTTNVSITNIPSTNISTTNVPTNNDSTTDIPTTNVSITNIPSTNILTTNVPTSNIPTTNVSITNIPSTNISVTNIPSTNVSTTNVPTSNVPTTNIPTTNAPTTNVPTTNVSTTNVSTTNVSTSPAVLIPDATPSTKSTTAAPCEVSESPPSTKVQPCSTRNVAKHCLIAISSLAALATIFMVSTIILCTKLSSRKYKVRNAQPATEMMCISALLPETNYTYSRQRNPVSNGVLVIHGGADSDEEGGDNLTLSSFLPENDRFV